MAEPRVPRSADPTLMPDEVAARSFTSAFRGFDQHEVRSFLGRLAEELRTAREREAELTARVAGAEARAAHPTVGEAELTAALGQEAARILQTAREAAAEIRTRTEEHVGRLLREAQDEATTLRADAEAALSTRTAEGERVADELRRAAAEQAEAELVRARDEAKRLVGDAEATRERILRDVGRRRRRALQEVERLRAARLRLLEAFDVVRATADRAGVALDAAEDDVQAVADELGVQLGRDPSAGDLPDLPPEPAAGDGPPAPESDAAPVGARSATPAVARRRPATAAAPVTAADDDTDDPDRPGPVALVLPPDDDPAGARRGSALRILRRGDERVPPGLPRGPARAVDAGDAVESVRVLPPEEAAATPPTPSTPAAAPVAGPTATSTPARPTAAPSPPSPPGPAPAADRPPAATPAAPPIPPPPASPSPPAAPSGPSPALPRTSSARMTPPPAADGPAAAGDGPTAPADPDSPVDALFARMRAERVAAVRDAEAVLAGADPDPGRPADPPGGTAGAGTPADDDHRDDRDADLDVDAAARRRRDEVLDPAERHLARALKRVLADDQNEALDRLRRRGGAPAATALLPEAGAHEARFRDVARQGLTRAAAAGGAAVAGSPAGDTSTSVDDLAAALAEEVVGPLRARLERALGDAPDDDQALAAVVSACYREWKTQRLDALARAAAAAAFGRGAYAAVPDGVLLRWVVDDDGGPCPDCDDNALAGALPRGEAFPTGQRHPPAHPGCRCLLAADTP